MLLIGFGVVLVSTPLQHRFATATSFVSGFADRWVQRLRLEGLGGQLAVGLLLGLVWAPCVGPTLGAASLLASKGQNLAQVATVMALFGVGAALPLAAVGAVSRRALAGARGGLLRTGSLGKLVLGIVMIVLGLLMLSGFDRTVEAFLVDISPGWLTNLTTRF